MMPGSVIGALLGALTLAAEVALLIKLAKHIGARESVANSILM